MDTAAIYIAFSLPSKGVHIRRNLGTGEILTTPPDQTHFHVTFGQPAFFGYDVRAELLEALQVHKLGFGLYELFAVNFPAATNISRMPSIADPAGYCLSCVNLLESLFNYVLSGFELQLPGHSDPILLRHPFPSRHLGTESPELSNADPGDETPPPPSTISQL